MSDFSFYPIVFYLLAAITVGSAAGVVDAVVAVVSGEVVAGSVATVDGFVGVLAVVLGVGAGADSVVATVVVVAAFRNGILSRNANTLPPTASRTTAAMAQGSARCHTGCGETGVAGAAAAIEGRVSSMAMRTSAAA